MIKTFPKGGVHPADHKLSAHAAIVYPEMPDNETYIIPVSQHIGKPANVIVERNSKVKVGSLIAKGDGFISANVHASVSGTVTKIDHQKDSSGYKRLAVSIRKTGDEWEEGIDRSPELITEITMEADDIIKRVKEAGIVGLGGATFPSHVKLMVPDGSKAEVLIVNGVECEPYLTSDHRLMLEKGAELIIGTKILMKALGVSKAMIGIEENKKDAIEHLTKICEDYPDIKVYGLQVKYPQGGEKQLIKALLDKEVPSGKIPVSIGAVVHNVGTIYSVYEAVQKNKPLLERVVTITGDNVETPANYMARIGIPLNRLVALSGGFPEHTSKIISGGPMMGKALNTVDVPITKGTSGILLVSEEEAKRRSDFDACIRCVSCVDVCPAGLEPYLLMTLGEKRMWIRSNDEDAMECIECGSCSFVCPSERPLLDYIRLSKGNIIAMKKNQLI
jgi:electron transport complex protein RnfC